MKPLMSVFFLVTVVFFIGCATHVHTVGDGPTSNKEVQTKQWYLIYGLYPLNDVDTQKMADGAESYEIKTQTTFMDGLISAFLGGNLLSARTVTVTK